jgi:polysaccharide deacetylase family protein (PEP-CTERM system associated)
MVNVLTVDVEDWYTSSLDVLPGAQAEHGQKPDESVVANTLSLLHLLSTHGHRATFFILGTVAEHYPEVVQAIAEGGHEVALHGYSHRLVYEMSPEEFRCDLAKGRELVEAAGAVGPFGYRAPYWSITKKSLWALEVLRAEGIRYDASIFPIGRQLYGIPDAPTGPHLGIPAGHVETTGEERADQRWRLSSALPVLPDPLGDPEAELRRATSDHVPSPIRAGPI